MHKCSGWRGGGGGVWPTCVARHEGAGPEFACSKLEQAYKCRRCGRIEGTGTWMLDVGFWLHVLAKSTERARH
uniref:HDC11219 n=1 Tax=Drosophila melanogaster TaxID=7227 RepID=Q6IKW6_DROME|nr:TPA_inf: HDC11219 [Drosophila melanogaster]